MNSTTSFCSHDKPMLRSRLSNLQFDFGELSRAAILILQFAILLLATQTSAAATRVEAYRGEPFGMARVTIDLPQGAPADAASDDRLAVVESNQRVLYPVIGGGSAAPVRRILRSFLNVETSSSATFYFMFRGDEPLDLTVYSPEPQRITFEPEDDAEEFNELLDDWWDATEDRFRNVFRQAEYPVLVENYLTATWARRLDREMPQPSRQLFGRFQLGAPWVSQLMANEAYQTQVEHDLLLGRLGADEQATLPLPGVAGVEREPAPSDQELPAPPAALPPPIEPIAAHVPRECFYMRFGNFPNYLWFRDFLRHWQGDLGNMIVMQSIDHNNSERFQQQIAVGESKLARVMGPTVIRDVAIIGLDPYMRDGAAMGILFHANNGMLLGRNLSGQREAAMQRHAGAAEKTVRIADHDVSFSSSPDGRLRSYYAIDGDYHLVANSRQLVERFFEAGAGDGALATTAGFQDARAARPLDRDDTIFLFASSSFLENLSGPHYRIELDRRLRSIGEMRALKLARFAAKTEGHNAESIDELIEVELLPPGFGQRIDGSKLVSEPSPRGQGENSEPSPPGRGQGEGAPAKGNNLTSTSGDTLRGTPGWMVPIPDVVIDKITPSEARRYAEFRRELENTVGGFSPISVALKREQSPADKGWDRITADIRVAPYSQMPIARWPNMLGPTESVRMAPIAGDVVSLELIVDALGEPVHLFGGLRDFRTPLVVRQGQVEADAPPAEYIRAYVGGWPRPHLIDRFLGRADGPLDEDGIAGTTGLFDLWLRRADDFFLFSFKRDVLLEVGEQLAMVDAEKPAQIRLYVDDLSDKQLADAVTAYGYMRARDASASGARFMNSLTTLLHVPVKDARTVADNLVAGTFDCPLNGGYVLVDPAIPLPAAGEGRFLRAKDEEEQLPAPGDEIPLPPRGEGLGEGGNVRQLWASTAPAPENRFLLTEIPADYTMPLMNWFRGLSADVARANDELTLHADLDMVHIEIGPPEDPEESGGLKLPSLGNLFSGFGKKKDDQVKPASATEGASPPKTE